MQTISAVEFKRWNKILTYNKFEVYTDDVKKVVDKIVWDWELDKIKKLPIKELQGLVDDILNYKWIDLLK